MYICVLLSALVGLVAGLILAIRTKKEEGVAYGKLDKAGKIVNVALIPLYVCLLPLCLLIGSLSEAHYEGVLGVLGWIVAFIIASAISAAGVGLGFSAALRKKGKSKLSFALQFAGMASILFAFLLFFAFYGNLLSPLN